VIVETKPGLLLRDLSQPIFESSATGLAEMKEVNRSSTLGVHRHDSVFNVLIGCLRAHNRRPDPEGSFSVAFASGQQPLRSATSSKTRPIEKEDEVSAIFEYENGAVGHFITTTGEAPGTDRLEIAGDRGKLVAENRQLFFHRATQSVQTTNRTTSQSFPTIETWKIEVPLVNAPAAPHKIITQNFVRAVLAGDTLIAPGAEGARGLEVGNAILLAGLSRQPVKLPLDAGDYERFLQELQAKFAGSKSRPSVSPTSVPENPLPAPTQN